jgi:hypothetical protein
LGAWTLWNHRDVFKKNYFFTTTIGIVVFDGASPNLARALTLALEDMSLWGIAGAMGISYLAGLLPM